MQTFPITRRSYLAGSAAMLAGMAHCPVGARAQAYPSQDIHFICGFAAGSGADIIVRFFAEKMRPIIGRTDHRREQAGRARQSSRRNTSRAPSLTATRSTSPARASLAGQHACAQEPGVDVGKALQIVGDHQPRDR